MASAALNQERLLSVRLRYALCMKLCQHNFTIAIVHKLLVHGHCSESGLYSLPSISSRCPRIMLISIFFLNVDEAEIEKLKASVFKAVRENNFSKAKEIQQKIDKILMDKTQASTNQNSLQGEKDYQLFVSSII